MPKGKIRLLCLSLILVIVASVGMAFAFPFQFRPATINNPKYSGSAELKEILTSHGVGIFSLSNGIGSCSGVVVDEIQGDHYIMTAKHCINVSEEVYVESTKAKLIITSINDDVAIIITDGKIENKTPVFIATDGAKIGDTIHHLGYPEDTEYVSTGKVSRITNDWHWAEIMSRSGCSGGGIYNNDGELVGILWGGYRTLKGEITIYESLKDVNTFLNNINKTVNLKIGKYREGKKPITENKSNVSFGK